MSFDSFLKFSCSHFKHLSEEMHTSLASQLLHILLALSFFIQIFLAEQTPKRFCGKIKIQAPFSPQNPLDSPLLNHMVLCKSEKLYLRTSLGLFQISSIDYKAKLLTIPHNSSASTRFISPSDLSAGFPSPPQPNSLILFDCSIQEQHLPPNFRKCKASLHRASSCLVVDDFGNLEAGFHPKDLNCSKYSRAYRSTLAVSEVERFEFGTRVSFDVPVPNPCGECEKSYGNCGAALRCLCHPKECKDKVISSGIVMNPLGQVVFFLLSYLVVIELFKGL